MFLVASALMIGESSRFEKLVTKLALEVFWLELLGIELPLEESSTVRIGMFDEFVGSRRVGSACRGSSLQRRRDWTEYRMGTGKEMKRTKTD